MNHIFCQEYQIYFLWEIQTFKKYHAEGRGVFISAWTFDRIRLVTVVYIWQKLIMKNMSLRSSSDPETLCYVGKYGEHFFVEYSNQATVVSRYKAAQKLAMQRW